MQSRAPAVSMDLTSYEFGHFPKMYEVEVTSTLRLPSYVSCCVCGGNMCYCST